MIKITDKNRQQIIYAYAEAILGNMNWDTMKDYAHSGIVNDLEKNSNEELEKTINEFDPCLLEDQ